MHIPMRIDAMTNLFSGDQLYMYHHNNTFESRHDKTNKMTVRPAKTQISLGIRPV